MIWIGIGIGLLVGTFVGVFAVCLVSIHRVNEMCEVLDQCRKVMSRYAPESSSVMSVCVDATRILLGYGWQAK